MNFDLTRTGWLYRYNKTQSQKFIQQDFSKNWFGFNHSVKWSLNNRYIEPNCSEVMKKFSLTMKKDFNTEDDQKSMLFKNNFKHSIPSYFYFKLIQKLRENKVGQRHCSATLLENAIGPDS